MVTLVPWVICLDELKTTKASKLEDEHVLPRAIYSYIKSIEDCQTQLDTCKNPPYPDLPEFHAAFKNATYPFPPTPPTNTCPPSLLFAQNPLTGGPLPLLPLNL
jgi:hypothetical protein